MKLIRTGYKLLLCAAMALAMGSVPGLPAEAAPPAVTEKTGTATWKQSNTMSYTFTYDIDAESAKITEVAYGGTNKKASITVAKQMQISYQGKTKKLNAVGMGDGKNPGINNTNTGRVTSMTLPETIREIGAFAFAGNGDLTEFHTGNGVERIGEAAFSGCKSLVTLTLGEAVGSVGGEAFLNAPLSKLVTLNCISLREGDNLFRDHAAITQFALGGKVTILPDGLFAGCTGIAAKTISIPNTVAYLGSNAFDGCRIVETLTLGTGLRELGESAFGASPLETVNFNCENLKDAGGNFRDRTGLKKFTLGSKVKVIPDGLFAGCTGLETKSIKIPDSVTYLGSNAFDSCDLVESITLGKGILDMGTDVFQSAYPYYGHGEDQIKKNKNALNFNCVNLGDVKGNFKAMEDRIAVRYGGAIKLGSAVQTVPDEIRDLMKFPDTTQQGTPGSARSYTAPYTGRYLLQAWGAAGGGGAPGGYAYGYYDMKKGDIIHIYTGKAGAEPKKTEKKDGGWNGGGDGTLGASSGGGATDFRTVKSKGSSGWNNMAAGKETISGLKEDESLGSRILIAGGGGGAAANGKGVKDMNGDTTGTIIGSSSMFGVGGGTSGGASQGVTKKASQSGGYAAGMGQDSCTVKAPTGHPGESASSTYGGAGGGGYYGGGQSECGRYTTSRKEDGSVVIAEVGGSGGGGSGYVGGVYGMEKSYSNASGKPIKYQDIGIYAGIPCYPNQMGGGAALVDGSTNEVIYGPDRREMRASGTKQANGAASITYVGAVSTKVTLMVDGKVGSFGGQQSLTLEGQAMYNRVLPKPDMINGYQFMRYEVYSGDGMLNQDGSYTHGFQDTVLKALCSGDLKLEQKPNHEANQGKGAVDLIWSEDDDFVKVFYVQQSTDKVHWVNLGDNGQAVEDVKEGFFRKKANGHGSKPNMEYSVTYTMPHTGTYYIAAAGGSGGVAHGAAIQGIGGLVKGKLSLQEGDVLTIELGGRGGHASGGSEESGNRGMGGWNGGGAGKAWNEEASFWGTGAGGGASRILVNGVTVMMAGGGGGGNQAGNGAGAGGKSIERIGDTSQDEKKVMRGDAGDDNQGGGGGGYVKGNKSSGGSSFFNEGGTITARLVASQGGGAKTLKLPEEMKGQYNSSDGMALLESILTFPKLEDNSYTANTPDKAPPDAPSAGRAARKGGGIEIGWDAPKDNGSIYYHRVGSCSDGGLTELRMSETLQSPEICSGVAGYYYYIDGLPTGTANRANGTYSPSNMGTATAEDNGKYAHAAAVDKAGNLGPTYSFLIDAPANYQVTFHGNGNWNGEQGSYTQTMTCDKLEELTPNRFTRTGPHTVNGIPLKEGYQFNGWSLSPSSTEVKYADKEKVMNAAKANENVDLYAVWSKTITLTFRLTGGSIGGSKEDVVLRHTIKNDKYDTYFNLLSEFDAYGSYDGNGINRVIKKNVKESGNPITYRFLGWTLDSGGGTEALKTPHDMDVYSPGKLQTYACSDSVTLYAVWEPVLSLLARGDRTYGNEFGTLAYATAVYQEENLGHMPEFKDGQQGKYTLETTGTAEIMDVAFDERFTWIYDSGDESVQDKLNPVNDESTSSKHGLNRRIGLDKTVRFQSESRYFKVPHYLGTERAPGSMSSDGYVMTLRVFNKDSYYWNTYRKQYEEARVHLKIPLSEEGNLHPTVQTHLH